MSVLEIDLLTTPPPRTFMVEEISPRPQQQALAL